MKFVKLLDIVKTGLAHQDETTRSFIRREIVKMMPRKLTTKELQKIEALRNLTGVFIEVTTGLINVHTTGMHLTRHPLHIAKTL